MLIVYAWVTTRRCQAAYRAWARDRDGGLEARLITQKLEVADALNVRAQAERLPQLLETARQDAYRQGILTRVRATRS